ncbi:MAG: aldehyde dehydrogenase family protein, partial [Candidatus Theseobacter exili]|nr:aldehyde dehydrogenase family protein [Candidatus Theseobacter exili]
MNTYKNYIDGKWQNSTSGKTFSDINPANKENIIGCFQQSNVKDVRKAIESANRAFEKWRKYPPAERAQILSRVLLLLKEKKKKLARDLTLEEGKT